MTAAATAAVLAMVMVVMAMIVVMMAVVVIMMVMLMAMVMIVMMVMVVIVMHNKFSFFVVVFFSIIYAGPDIVKTFIFLLLSPLRACETAKKRV